MGDDLAPRLPGTEPGAPGTQAGTAGTQPGAAGTGTVLLEQEFDADSLFALRAAVAAHAAAAGLSGNRLYDVVTTAHELAANAVRHGAGRGRLRLRLAHEGLSCEVSDAGRAADGATGDAPRRADGAPAPSGGGPAWREQHGHGLWVVGQVADQFTIDRTAAATTATAVFALGAPAAGDEAGRGAGEVRRPGGC